MTGRCAHTNTHTNKQTHIERTHYLRHSLRSVGGDNHFIIYKKLQAIYLMLYKRYKTAKIKKYKHEYVLAYTFNLSSVARINV